MNYYDANAVAYESELERYSDDKEISTSDDTKNIARTALESALFEIINCLEITRDDALNLLICAIEEE